MQSESRREGIETLLLGQVTSGVVPRMHPFQLYFACALLYGSLTIQGAAVLFQPKYTFLGTTTCSVFYCGFGQIYLLLWFWSDIAVLGFYYVLFYGPHCLC